MYKYHCAACDYFFNKTYEYHGGCVRCGFPDPTLMVQKIRTFETGATRDQDATKLDYEGFLSPIALKRFAEYMHQHRTQPDGELRSSDNWQKGIPLDAYMKSMFRHFVDVWSIHRGQKLDITMDDALCALLFNVQGYLHEWMKERRNDSSKNN